MSQYDDVMNKKAVALRYDENKDVAPVIVASGLGYMAERIVEMANENGVPVYEDNSLATVLTQLDLGTAIPEELYQAIVDIYAYFLKYNPTNAAHIWEDNPSNPVAHPLLPILFLFRLQAGQCRAFLLQQSSDSAVPHKSVRRSTPHRAP